MFIFGIIDNGILLVCLLAGASLEDFLPDMEISNPP